MTPKSAEEVAREIGQNVMAFLYRCDAKSVLVPGKVADIIAQALRVARREALEEAAKQVDIFVDGAGQGLIGSTVARIAGNIRALASPDEEKGGG